MRKKIMLACCLLIGMNSFAHAGDSWEKFSIPALSAIAESDEVKTTFAGLNLISLEKSHMFFCPDDNCRVYLTVGYKVQLSSEIDSGETVCGRILVWAPRKDREISVMKVHIEECEEE